MSIITKMLQYQTAVYWPALGPGNGGQLRFDQPLQIKVRWEDKVVEFTDCKGQIQLSSAVVYVDRDVTIGGALWLGSFGGLSSSDPLQNPAARTIKGFSKVGFPIKQSEFLRTVYL